MVDGSGSTPGASISITAGIAALVPGDTVIDVVGLVDANGDPVGYSQTPFLATQGAETFPLVVPPGITIRQMGSAPVYVWDSFGTPGLILFELEPSLVGPALTRLTNLTIMGGFIGVSADWLTAPRELDVLVKSCRFSGQTIATRASTAAGAEVRFGLQNCTITDATITSLATPPFLRAPRDGFQFFSSGAGTGFVPSATTGVISDLSVIGDFAIMAPSDPMVARNDLLIPTTKLIHVFAGGDEDLREYGDAPASYVPIPIPVVTLDILGGTWSGGDISQPTGGGWDVAVYAEAEGDGAAFTPHDYRCGYEVTLAGTEIADFREDGIYCSTSLNSRGNLSLAGGIRISDIGTGATVETANSGVHLYSVESYLGLQATACEFSENLGNGVYANTGGNLIVNLPDFLQIAPQGLYVDITKSKIHKNGANGVFLRNEGSQPGFIGGTIHQDPAAAFNIDDDGRGFTVPNGQGRVNRTSISNNGMSGIKIRAIGDSGIVPEEPDTIPAGVSILLSNNFIWHNPEGGIRGQWLESGFDKGYFLVPIAHNTLVGNGGAGFEWSIEIDDQNGLSSTPRAIYEWAEPGSGLEYRTNIWNTNLVRDPVSGLGPDLGPVLFVTPFNSMLDDDIVDLADDIVGFAGTRGNGFWPIFSGPPRMSVQSVLPFVGTGGFVLSSTDPDQFKLFAPVTQDEIVDFTPINFFNVIAPDTVVDHGNQSRPGALTGIRDKGADEVDQ